MRREKPYYGGASWHVFINAVLGTITLIVAVLLAFFNRFWLLLLILAVYLYYRAFGWRRGEALEERLRIRDALINVVKPKDGDRILDVGTGGGLLAIGFAKAIERGEVVGMDVWMKMGGGTSIERAKRNAEIEGVAQKVKFKYGDARNIPYPDEYFDIVVSSFTIHIIREKEKALKEMIRVLKRGGKFAIIEPKQERWTGWKVDEKLKQKLEELGLKNIKFQPLTLNYPKTRQVYIIHGTKT